MRVDKSKWHKDLLGNLCNIKRGGSPRPIQKFLTDDSNGINWIKIGDAGDSKFISSCKEKIIQEGVSKSRFVHKGDFLLSNSMSFGRPYILNVDGCIHDGWLVLEQPKQFDKTYLYYLLGSAPMYEKFAKKAQGAVVNNLNIERVASIEIAYPPLNIQQSIASELDAVQEMIDGYKAQIADLDALAQSIFLDMFGNVSMNDKSWNIIPMGKLGDFKNGLNYNKGEQGKSIKIIGVGDFQNIKSLSSFNDISSVRLNIFQKNTYFIMKI
jgi:restriction endonuclease S subunit